MRISSLKNKARKAVSSIKPKLLVVAVSSCIAFSTLHLTTHEAHASAQLRTQMNNMFGTMSNVTPPGVYQSARRGVISGGSLQVRSRIVTTNIMNFTPPSISHGCGGIDFFGGSFSFINSEQFVALARTVAANALPFAFYLAIKAMAPDVANVMTKIQEFVDIMNRFLGNSCQLAMGIVADTASAVGIEHDMKASFTTQAREGKEAIMNLFAEPSKTGFQNADSQEVKDLFFGNVTWQAMKTAQSRIAFSMMPGTTSNETLELIMSVSGYVSVTEDQEPRFETPVLSFTDFMKGKKDAAKFSCAADTEKCPDPSISYFDLDGFEKIYLDKMLGSDVNPGIVRKIRSNQDLSQEEQNFLSNLPSDMAGMIFKLSRKGDPVVQFVISSADSVALQMAFDLINSYFHVVQNTLQTQKDSAFYNEALRVVKDSELKMIAEYTAMSAQATKSSDIARNYHYLMEATGRRPLVPAAMGSSDSSSLGGR